MRTVFEDKEDEIPAMTAPRRSCSIREVEEE
jgi:hypothetical protein